MSIMSVIISLHEVNLAILTNAKVAAREDHDALLFVLTDNTQLFFAFALNLTNQQSLDLILISGTFGFRPGPPLVIATLDK